MIQKQVNWFVARSSRTKRCDAIKIILDREFQTVELGEQYQMWLNWSGTGNVNFIMIVCVYRSKMANWQYAGTKYGGSKLLRNSPGLAGGSQVAYFFVFSSKSRLMSEIRQHVYSHGFTAFALRVLHDRPWVQFDVIYKWINCPAGYIEQENVYSKSGWAMQILIGRINLKKLYGRNSLCFIDVRSVFYNFHCTS